MALRKSLEKIILEYPLVSKDNFKGHSFASYVRNVVPKSISASLELPEIYSVKASAGNGSWAKVPWIAIFNNLVTESVQSGFYCVYLFRADFSGVYLSLNQGIADKRNKFGLGKSRDMVRDQAQLFKDKLGSDQLREFSEPLDLQLDSIPKKTTSRRLGLAYEAGNIASKFYSRESLPDDKELVDDVRKVLEIYFSLFEEVSLKEDADSDLFKKVSLKKEAKNNEAEREWFEDPTKYRLHRVTERNQTLSRKVKELQGYECKACGFDFESRYGEIGKGYIEAHHNVPISNLSGAKIQVDPLNDFTVLCSNCHSMIHRIKPTPTVEEFRQKLKI
ncbi:MrcB family domain-containing protein [Microcoleus sp. MON2_D5]|uniref:MrcB family domain-containing protein n=1 Tax=Microcoleus sp. MON2_D5 TaxID=2818833 RepID=UPI002FD18472